MLYFLLFTLTLVDCLLNELLCCTYYGDLGPILILEAQQQMKAVSLQENRIVVRVAQSSTTRTHSTTNLQPEANAVGFDLLSTMIEINHKTFF